MKTTGIAVCCILFFAASSLEGQDLLKQKPERKAYKYTLTFNGGLSYVLGSANGEGRDFSSWYNPAGGNIFNSSTFGMQEGYGVSVTGRMIVSKNKKFRVTGTLGFNHFYNSEDKGLNRTRWNIFNLEAGVEYNFSPRQRESMFLVFGVDYNLMFGAWQSDITYPDNSVSNIYTWFKPASRLGISGGAGMQIALSRKSDLVIGIKGVWVNIFPKNNYYSNEVFHSYINDSGSSNGIELPGRKDIIYLQVTTGITIPVGIK